MRKAFKVPQVKMLINKVLNDEMSLSRLVEILNQHAAGDAMLRDWNIDSVDRYFYSSGRNYWTYVETTYWFDSFTMERKETGRQVEILTGEEWRLPPWAQGITRRVKSLERDYY